jgi:hypothetical protein
MSFCPNYFCELVDSLARRYSARDLTERREQLRGDNSGYCSRANCPRTWDFFLLNAARELFIEKSGSPLADRL